MTSPGRGDLGGIESETFDFSQLEEYINDDSESNIYFHDPLVSSSELRVGGQRPKEVAQETAAAEGTDARGGQVSLGHACVTEQQKGYARNADISSSSFTKPHHLPDSPPDSGSEPPFSPNEDPKLRCPSIELLHHHHQLGGDMSTEESLKHPYHLGFTLATAPKHIPDSSSSSISPTSTSSSPHHHHHQHHHHHHHHQGGQRHHSPVPASPVPVHSTHSSSMPVLAGPALTAGQLVTQIPQSILSPYTLQQQILAAAPTAPHLSHLYTGGDEFLYDSLSNPVTSTTTSSKKRKLPESPKQRSHPNNGVHVKTEPSAPSPDPSTTMLPSSEDDYSFDLSSADANSLFVDSSYQCIRFQPFQQNTWCQLLDKDMKEIPSPHFRVDADKGFNYSNADESFVCQKKNHFQVTVHVQPQGAEARYVRPQEGGGARPIERFALHFHGVKMESPTQIIKVEQSQSDRSKRPFHPVPLEMVLDQVTKTTVGRLHFSETTSNNMRKKGKPNPDQRFFFLVVSLCAHVTGGDALPPCTVVAYASEKIIVRASNPGQFENDMELSWQKGHTMDSIFHNGRVGINTDRPEEALVVHGNIKVTGHILQPSDIRAKYDIHELDTREQLRNVANLRIVRYRYLPEVGDRLGVGVGLLPDIGVIAQEVQGVIPDAVVEAGDLVLKDGKLIEKLLVVSKERIFMENVGAVKELCKVTDNLETRIDELERINKKLSNLKRKDSFKSTSTDLSRVSSVSHGKRKCRHYKGRAGYDASACSSHFIQSTIIVLVIIMACCLLALATLYIMEFQSRSERYYKTPYIFQVSSTPVKNGTSPAAEKFTILSTLFPTVSISRQSTLNYAKTTSSVDNVSPKLEPKWTPASVQTIGPPDADPFSLSVDLDCVTEECPVYCCDPFEDEDEMLFPVGGQEDPQPIERRRRSGDQVKQLSQTAARNGEHKIRKRLTAAEEENMENNNVFMPVDEGVQGPTLHLLELNITLFPELCIKERAEGMAAEYMTCSVHISKHFPHPNVTLHISDEPDTVIEYCGRNHYTSCTGRVVQDEKAHSRGSIAKRDLLPRSHVWKLPVGSHFRSRYRFRMMSRQVMFPADQPICSLGNNRPFTEYILTFQRRCDK